MSEKAATPSLPDVQSKKDEYLPHYVRRPAHTQLEPLKNYKDKSTNELIRYVMDACKISLDGDVISHETISEFFCHYLSETAEKGSHNLGIVLHTGSIIFEALAVTYAAISCVLQSQTSPTEIIENLEHDDIVVFIKEESRERYRFDKISTENGIRYAVLKSADKAKTTNNTTKVPSDHWNQIIPYNGSAEVLGGIGFKKGRPAKFRLFNSVLGMKSSDIPYLSDTSTVILMSKEHADHLMECLTISYGDITVYVSNLATASYYTENDEYPYKGNIGKNEPALKFTGKLFVARKLIKSKRGNRHIGLLICGDDII